MLFERYYFDVFLVKIVVLAKVADSGDGPYRLLKNDPHPALYIYLSMSFYFYSLTIEQLEGLVVLHLPFLQLFPCNLF